MRNRSAVVETSQAVAADDRWRKALRPAVVPVEAATISAVEAETDRFESSLAIVLDLSQEAPASRSCQEEVEEAYLR